MQSRIGNFRPPPSSNTPLTSRHRIIQKTTFKPMSHEILTARLIFVTKRRELKIRKREIAWEKERDIVRGVKPHRCRFMSPYITMKS